MTLLIDILGLAGVILLAVPVWHINKYALLASRLANLRVRLDDPTLSARRVQIVQNLRNLQGDWKRWKALCLAFGTAAAAASYALSLISKLTQG
jgi:hypothetical protein